MPRRLLAVAVVALGAAILSPPASAETLSDRDFNRLRRQAQAAARAGEMSALAGVLRDLAADDSERAAELIAAVAAQVPAAEVYDAAVDALGRLRSAEAIEAMVDAVESRRGNPALKMMYVDAFAHMDDPRTGEALGAAANDRNEAVVRAAMSAIRERKPIQAVPGLIDLLEKFEENGVEEGLLANDLRRALWEITGEHFEAAEDWRKFWEIQGQNFNRPRTGGEPPDELTTSRRQDTPTFYGSEILSTRVVFVIDISGSMQGERLESCKTQLTAAIEGLTERSAFTIVAYSASNRVWNEGLQQANPRNKARAVEFVQGLQASGNTLTLKALEQAFETEGADAIVLLSDGVPTETDPDTGQPMTTDAILERVQEINRFKRWRIDTFGFNLGGMAGGAGSLDDFMRELAEQNDGEFTVIN